MGSDRLPPSGKYLLPVSAACIVILSLFFFLATDLSYRAIEFTSRWVRNYFGYFYLYLGLGCVLLLLGISFSPLGKIRLGNAKTPQYSHWAWSAMLYSAGMGAGILLRAVQEPVYMLYYPPFESAYQPEILALEYTFYQWGFTAWAFYGIFAAIIGYSLFVRQRPVRVSATVLRVQTNRKLANGIDILTIITTVFGLIAAIGLGTAQIRGGINHLTQWDSGLGLVLALASLISLVAFISVWQGVDRGIRQLSKLNILLTLLLLGYILVLGDIPKVIGKFGNALYHYLLDFIPMSLALPPFDPGIGFLTDWTFYYWAFWLAWAPFTGIFIARISRGRTIRQLLLGVLVIPSLGTFFWFTVFGSAAFDVISGWPDYNGEFDNVFTSLFVFLQAYPLNGLLNVLSLLLLVGYLVTSVDSAVFVLSMFTDRGRKDPAKEQRLIWSAFILLATLALLVLADVKPGVDVLVAAQKLLIITSLPFAFILIVMAIKFIRDAYGTLQGKKEAGENN